MRSLRRNIRLWFYALLVVGIVLIITSFVDISDVIGNYSFEQRWDVMFEQFNGNTSASEGLAVILKEKNIPSLLAGLKNHLFVNRKDLTDLENAVDNMKIDDSISETNVYNVIRLARKTLAEASKNELLFLKVVIVTLICFAVFMIVFAVFIPLRRFLNRMDSISEEFSNFDIEKKSTLKTPPFLELKKMVNAFNTLVGKFETYRSILNVAERSKTIEDLTEELYRELKKTVNFNRVAFSTLSEDKIVSEVAFSDSKDVFLKPPFVRNLSGSSINEVLKSRKPRIIDDLEEYLEGHPASEATRMIVKEGMRSSLTFPICVGDRCKGLLFLNSFERKGFSEADLEKFETIQKFISLAYQKTTLTRDLLVGTVTSFTKLVEKKDNETGLHLVRMAEYSRLISEELFNDGRFREIDPRYIQRIHLEAPLHDIGKIGIPDRILLKPGKLTHGEFEVMKTHSAMGSDILEEFDELFEKHGRRFFEMGSRIARHHHEKWDGSGYPGGLSGNDIPLCARIVAVADVFDALTSKRPYKEAFDYDRSVKIILEGSGTHFDPAIVGAFMGTQPEIKKVYEKLREV